MNTILFCVIISIIIYAYGGILTIRLPFTKICQITIIDKPIDIDWSSNNMHLSYVNNTNDTHPNCEYTYFTSYNLAMLFV
jgi:hypothetical protein